MIFFFLHHQPCVILYIYIYMVLSIVESNMRFTFLISRSGMCWWVTLWYEIVAAKGWLLAISRQYDVCFPNHFQIHSSFVCVFLNKLKLKKLMRTERRNGRGFDLPMYNRYCYVSRPHLFDRFPRTDPTTLFIAPPTSLSLSSCAPFIYLN